MYALPFYLFIDRPAQAKGSSLFRNFFTKSRLKFALISAGTFLALLALFYAIYGFVFLHETYLYHLIRKDNRHNFSVYFYYIYLNFDQITKMQSLLTFLPQFMLVLTVGIKLFRDLPFCLFLQTYLFVMFNKVCTAQYFIWYMCFLPLIMGNSMLYKDK